MAIAIGFVAAGYREGLITQSMNDTTRGNKFALIPVQNISYRIYKCEYSQVTN